MPTGAADDDRASPPGLLGVGFLLAQVGSDSAARFARRLARTGLTPPEGALLRMVAGWPGQSQQALADRLDVAPSRVVAILDGLESKGLVQRRPHASDRRAYSIDLTAAGRRSFGELRKVGMAHEKDICAPLDDDERAELVRLLTVLADHQSLKPGVHPALGRSGPAPG